MSTVAMSSVYTSVFNNASQFALQYSNNRKCVTNPIKWRIRASSSAAPGVDLSTLQTAIAKAAFLFTVVGTTGFLGILTSQLPGDWGFSVPYLIGSISLIVLAVGSISPGLLQAAIGGFSSFFPDYQDRIARHEAAHFLVAYLLGVPILGYSLDIGKEHVNLIDERLEKLIYSGQLDAKELDRLAVVAMAGLAAEGLKYDKVVGQSADLFTLQRFINRSKPQLNKDQQQNLTRWAVLFAGSLLKNNRVLHEALISAMSKKATVLECIEAVEKTG